VDQYDVVVIGAGPAGETAAGRAAGHGLSVAMVESELVGGECSYWGCIPSKVLLRPGDVLAAARRVPGAAAAVTGEVDVAAVFARRDEATSHWDDRGQLPWLSEHGIDLVRGRGRLAGQRLVEVAGADGSSRLLSARRAVVLAAGTTAAVPPVPGLADAASWTNRGATAAKEVPRRLLVLGGGAIGVELAQAFRRLGSAEVTVVEGGDRLLPREEPFAGAEVAAALEAEGVRVVTGHRAAEVRRRGADGPVSTTLDDGVVVLSDEVLVAAGRRPATRDLGLATVGLPPGAPVEVDDRLRAAGVDGGWLYAVGDVNGRAQLTHMAKYQGRIAGDVIAGLEARDRASLDIVPRVTFTDPQVCAVGLTEEQARASHDRVRVTTFATGAVAGAYTLGEGVAGTSKLVVDDARRVLLGATFTGPGTAELLHSATVAIAGSVTLDDLWHAVPSFPTVSEVWLRLLEGYGL
jgi:pyruvate/2-oxoglutarate dehydrogenase complex dihydrolipoamide dehydrogenase (E3) component